MKSENIKWGLQKSIEFGTSKLYSHKSFWYNHNEKGELGINEDEAQIVKVIFDYYLQWDSIRISYLQHNFNRYRRS